MADNGSPPAAHHRHARHPRPGDRRRRLSLIAVGVLVVAAIAVALVVASSDGSSTAVADQPIAATAPTPTKTPVPTVTVTATATATSTSDVPGTFVDAMQQLGIPLDADTGWAVAQGICVRLGQPARYDEFTMAEGIERLFPSVHDEQAHAFVDMVATSVCHL
jgi:hypothetical protein